MPHRGTTEDARRASVKPRSAVIPANDRQLRKRRETNKIEHITNELFNNAVRGHSLSHVPLSRQRIDEHESWLLSKLCLCTLERLQCNVAHANCTLHTIDKQAGCYHSSLQSCMSQRAGAAPASILYHTRGECCACICYDCPRPCSGNESVQCWTIKT